MDQNRVHIRYFIDKSKLELCGDDHNGTCEAMAHNIFRPSPWGGAATGFSSGKFFGNSGNTRQSL